MDKLPLRDFIKQNQAVIEDFRRSARAFVSDTTQPHAVDRETESMVAQFVCSIYTHHRDAGAATYSTWTEYVNGNGILTALAESVAHPVWA